MRDLKGFMRHLNNKQKKKQEKYNMTIMRRAI